MNPDELLRQRLSGLPVPPPDPAARDRALHRATVALRATGHPGSAPGSRWPSWWTASHRTLVGGVSALVLIAALGVAFTLQRAGRKRSPTTPTAECALLSQMEGLFGAQLDAIVESTNEAPDIRLSADATDFARPRLAQPVLIQFQRVGGETTRVLSYSGRTVCVTLGGRRMCFEPLVTGRDEVILSGGAFCWSSERPAAGWNGYQVTARLLPRS